MADRTTLQVVIEGKDDTTKVLKGIESSVIRFVGAVSAALAAVKVVVFPVEAAATFQRELLNVAKTTNFTDTQVSQLAEGLKQLSYHTNVAADDLAKIAAAGGQMGLGTEGVEGILSFTEAASRMSSVLDMTAEDSGAALGRLTNIFKVSIKDSEKISSLLNQLSNNSTAKGADLVDMMQRIGTAGGTLDIKMAAALAATGRDLGMTLETTGTSINKIFLDLQTKADKIAPILGIPVAEFSKKVKEDGVGALKDYLLALNKMSGAQKAAFAENTTGGGRVFAAISALAKDGAGGFALLNKHIAEANIGFDEGTSAISEQERVLTGLIAQGQVLINVLTGVAESAGRKALPYLTKLTTQLQAWAKDPAVGESFDRLATFIGGVAEELISLIGGISRLSSVMGPLLTVIKLWIGMKILSTVIGVTSSLFKQANAAKAAASAWYALLTANKATVQAMAESARKVEAANAAVAGAGKSKTVSTAGRIAMFMDSSLNDKFAAQDKLAAQTQEMANAELLLTQRTQQRATVLASIRAEQERITSTYKQQAQQAYDAVLAAGGTKKAARLAQNDVKASLNRAALDLAVAQSNLEQKFSSSLSRRAASLQLISKEAASTKKAVEGMSTIGTLFATVTARGASLLSGFGSLAMGVLRFGGAIAIGVGSVSMLLDSLGLLDPLVSKVKALLGIMDEESAEKQRAAAEQQKAWESELRQASEMLKVYEAQKKAKVEAAKAGLQAPTQEKNILDKSLASQLRQLQVVNGAYLALSAKGAELAGNIDFINARWQSITQQLAVAKREYEELAKARTNQGDSNTQTLYFKVSDADIAAAKAKMDDLASSLDLLGKARSRFEQELATNTKGMKEASQDAIENAVRLAPLYDAAGVAALQAFNKVLQGRDKLDAARKSLQELEAAGTSPKASPEEKTAYFAAAQNVKILEQELSVLGASYDQLRLSSSNATVFMANAFPDATKATITQVQALLRLLSTTGDTTGSQLEKARSAINKQAAEIEKAISEVEATRRDRISNLDSLPDKTGDAYKFAINKINEEAKVQATALQKELATTKSRLSAMDLEKQEAAALSGAYSRISEAKKKSMDSGRGLVANYASVAAIKALTDQQIAAQKRVAEGAKFNADNIKRLAEEAKTALNSTVEESKRELGSLGQYFQSRNMSLRLANYDINQNRSNALYTKMQEDILSAEKERLAAQGLSTEEIAEQVKWLQESFEWESKIRQAQQDEARQRLVINSLQQQIKEDEEAIAESSAKALEFTKKAKEAQAAGDETGAANFVKQAAVEAEKAKIATEGLTDTVKEYKAEAAKPVSDQFGAKFIVSDDQVRSVVESSAKARVEAAQAIDQSMSQAKEVATKWSVEQEAVMTDLVSRSKEYQQTLDAITQLAPKLAEMQNDLAAAVLANTSGASDVISGLQSIATQDFRGLEQFKTISEQATAVSEMSTSIQDMARSYAETVVPAGKSIKEVTDAVATSVAVTNASNDQLYEKLKKGMAEVAVQASEIAKSVQSALAMGTEGKEVSAGVKFPGAGDELQSQLNDRTFSANVQFSSAGQAQAHAEGGYITGPGTGTSDSILSWLSNREYVSDAQTTAFWGPGFFQSLKSIARGGRNALTRFATKVSGGVSLPAFAGGGYVGVQGVGGVLAASAAASVAEGKVVDRVAVDLNVGKEKVSLLGDRKEVERLTKALHRANRG